MGRGGQPPFLKKMTKIEIQAQETVSGARFWPGLSLGCRKMPSLAFVLMVEQDL